MRLQAKVYLIIGVVALVLIALFYMASNMLLGHGFTELAQLFRVGDAERLAGALQQQKDLLSVYLLIFCFIVAAVILTVAHIMVDRLVLKRIERLRRQAEAVAESGRLDCGIDVDGRDEIADLGHEFNRMLSKIALAQDQIESAKTQAEVASRAKSEFLANMSHEIRTPLTAIMGYSELLSAEPLEAEQAKQYLATVQSNGEQLLELIRDILDLSKVEAGELLVRHETTEWTAVIQDVVASHQAQANKKQIQLVLECRGQVPRKLVTDSQRLRQILQNLVANAIKFTSEGRVCVEVSVVGTPVAQLSIAVKDTGIGVRRQDMDKLFKPFQQVDMSSTRNYQGTGLGLSISRHLARLLGGDLYAQSDFGTGSCFTLLLPLAADDLADMLPGEKACETLPRAQKEIAWPALQGSILLVEDNSVILLLVKTILARFGLKVVAVENGAEACDYLLQPQAPDVDLVLMDMQMPVMDGMQATRRLREARFNKPIVALTANAMQGDREQYLKIGCDDFVSKPVNSERLYHCISRLLAVSA